MQPTPVLSLGSDLWSPSLSSQILPIPACEQTSFSGWWVLVDTDPLCRNLSSLPSAPLLLHSPSWFRSFPPAYPLSPPVKGLPSVWKPFLLHRSLPEVHVPSLFFCVCFFFFLLPYPGTWEFLAFWELWGLLPAFNRCSVGTVPHVDVFLIYLWGGRWSPCLTPPSSWKSPPKYFKTFFLRFFFSMLNFLLCCIEFGELLYDHYFELFIR